MSQENQIYVCTICNIFANTELQLEEHLKGFRHHKNHKKLIIGNKCNGSIDLRVYAMTFVVVFVTTFVFFYVIIIFVNVFYNE